jgi:hypothetical protein
VLIHDHDAFSSFLSKIDVFFSDAYGDVVTKLLRAVLREVKEYRGLLGKDHKEFMIALAKIM